MNEKLFDHINIKMENTHIPDGVSDNPKRTCEEFEVAIEASGGIDLLIAGMGRIFEN